MKSYCLELKIKPMIENNDPQSIAKACAAVYVFCDTEEEAKTKSVNHLLQYQWEVLETKSVHQMTAEEILYLDEASATDRKGKGYREAKTTGISFVILDALPKFLDH